MSAFGSAYYFHIWCTTKVNKLHYTFI